MCPPWQIAFPLPNRYFCCSLLFDCPYSIPTVVTVPLAGLDAGTHVLELTPTAEAADLDPTQFRDLRIEATLDLGDARCWIRFTASATATLLCDRTLVLYDTPVQGEHAVLFARDVEEVHEDEEVYPFNPATDRFLNITDPVRDTLLLALPVRRVAPGAEEIELPTTFGADPDSSTDPRWDALRRRFSS